MNYEFQSTLYRNSREVTDAIAEAWMTGGGMNNENDIKGFLASCDDEHLTSECIRGWGLDEAQDTDDHTETETWLATRGLTRDDIVRAFSRFRSTH